jgi:polysaccharide export outer membrane protein
MYKLFLLFALIITLQSCHLREKMVYLQEDQSTSSKLDSTQSFAPKLRPDDLLQIQVGGQDMQALAPFQFYVMDNSSNPQGMQALNTIFYLVDPNGNINFPVLGFVKVAGLTRLEATIRIQELLSLYVTNPVVNIQIKNFKVSILGEVARPGIYTMPSDRISILEALAMAGDLKLSGIRRDILLVREQDGKRIEYRLDLTQKDLYKSPAYYLVQNDVIYVEPNRGARFQGQNLGVFTQVVTPVISLMLSIYTLFALN